MTTLEFALPHDHAGRLFRQPAIVAARVGRARRAPVSVTWHDFEGGGLARDGLVIAEQDGVWRLLRPLRADGFPAGVETVREADGPGPLLGNIAGAAASARTLPLAAFQGRSTRAELASATGGRLSVTLLAGVLRNVASGQPCCRVVVEAAEDPPSGPNGDPVAAGLGAGEAGGGPDAAPAHALPPPHGAAAARLALALGSRLPLAPALQSLPELARLGGGAPAPVPAVPTVPAEGDVDAALAALLGGLAAALLRQLPEAAAGSVAGVHQSRVAIRRFRSALSLFRGAVSREAEDGIGAVLPGLLGLAERLGRARDWDVFLAVTGEAVAAAIPDRRIEALLADARQHRAVAYAALERHLAQRPTQRLLLHVSLLPALRPWREPPAGADPAAHAALLATRVASVAPSLVDRQFRRLVRGRRALADAADEALHDARKDAKRLRYALEFLSPVLKRGDTRRLVRLVSRAQDQLGAINDGAAGAALLATLPKAGGKASGGHHDFAVGAIRGWLAARGEAARREFGGTWAELRRQDRFWRD